MMMLQVDPELTVPCRLVKTVPGSPIMLFSQVRIYLIRDSYRIFVLGDTGPCNLYPSPSYEALLFMRGHFLQLDL